MPDAPRFSRRSVVAACNLLADRIGSHALFERMAMDIGAEDLLVEGPIQAKANVIAQWLIAKPDHRNWEGEFLADVVVCKAASLPYSYAQDDFVRALARDGFTVTEEGEVRRMLPETADLGGSYSPAPRGLARRRNTRATRSTMWRRKVQSSSSDRPG